MLTTNNKYIYYWSIFTVRPKLGNDNPTLNTSFYYNHLIIKNNINYTIAKIIKQIDDNWSTVAHTWK